MTKYLFLLGTVAALGTANAHVTEGYRVMHDGSLVHSSVVVDEDSPVMYDKDKADYINYGHIDRTGDGGVVDGDPYDDNATCFPGGGC